MIISFWILLRIRNFSDKIVEKIRTSHFMFSPFFPNSCRSWDNVHKYGRVRRATEENIIGRMRFTYSVTGKNTDTHTHRIMNTYCFSTATLGTRTLLIVTLDAHCLSCLLKCEAYACSFTSCFNVIYALFVLTINVSPNICALSYTIYDILYKLVFFGTQVPSSVTHYNKGI